MGKWTPVVIEGGKSECKPGADFLEAFERAGFATESGMFDYEKILANLEAHSQSDELPLRKAVVTIITNPYDEQDLQFLF